MSGIAGILHRDGAPAAPETMAAMAASIARRGSDASGTFSDGPIALAHRAMWTTPESVFERQPIVRASSSLRLVADARIDNRAELIALLGVAGATRVGDAEIIARAYERWGTRCVEFLLGDFAFALWDARSRRLFCARDPMGVKPFYYHQTERVFAFASEAKALLAIPGVPDDVDPVQVAAFLDGSITDRRHTHYRAIMRLPAAHTLTIANDCVRLEQYWRPDAKRELHLSTSDQYAEAFREIFSEAVRARLRSVRPIGAALSGGLDSSSIVCMARKLNSGSGASPLHTFSLVFPSLPPRELERIDERRYIDRVVRGGGVIPTYVRGDELSPVSEVDEVLDALDEPYGAPNLYLHWSMYRAMRDCGARVFLDGFDGDTVVSHGLGRLNTLARRGEWDVFEREVRALAAHRRRDPEFILEHFGLPYLAVLARRGNWIEWASAARQLSRRFARPMGRLLLNSGLRPAIPSALRGAFRRVRGAQPATRPLIVPEMARRLARDSYELEREADRDVLGSDRDAHVEGLSQPAYQLTLEMADKCAAALGVSPRYPFFDRRLIEFCLAVPESEKFAGGWSRMILRRAMQEILPASIRWRSDKGNLSPNFHLALRAAQAMVAEPDHNSPLAAHVDLGVLREMRRRYCGAATTLGESADGHTLFRVMVLERWLSRRDSSAANRPAVEATAAA